MNRFENNLNGTNPNKLLFFLDNLDIAETDLVLF